MEILPDKEASNLISPPPPPARRAGCDLPVIGMGIRGGPASRKIMSTAAGTSRATEERRERERDRKKVLQVAGKALGGGSGGPGELQSAAKGCCAICEGELQLLEAACSAVFLQRLTPYTGGHPRDISRTPEVSF